MVVCFDTFFSHSYVVPYVLLVRGVPVDPCIPLVRASPWSRASVTFRWCGASPWSPWSRAFHWCGASPCVPPRVSACAEVPYVPCVAEVPCVPPRGCRAFLPETGVARFCIPSDSADTQRALRTVCDSLRAFPDRLRTVCFSNLLSSRSFWCLSATARQALQARTARTGWTAHQARRHERDERNGRRAWC